MRRTYDTFDGRNLRDPELKFYFPHNDCCPDQQANLGNPAETTPCSIRSLKETC